MDTRNDPTRELFPRGAVRLLYIRKSRVGSDWNEVPHTHAYSEMFYCIRGQGRINIGGKFHKVEPDDLVLINPRVQHAQVGAPAFPPEYVVLGMEGLEFLFDGGEQGYTLLRCGPMREELLFMIRLLLREAEQQAEGYERICQNLLEVLLVKLVRLTSVSLRVPRVSPKSKECAAAKQYLDENFRQNISLDQLAAVTHINKYYLAHAFQKEYNISPINYLLRRRISESKILLAETDHNLTRISALVGFSSPSYFSQSFRRLEGMSPMEYRRISRSAVPVSRTR